MLVYERRNLIYLFDEYKKWNGNSYISKKDDKILKILIADE